MNNKTIWYTPEEKLDELKAYAYLILDKLSAHPHTYGSEKSSEIMRDLKMNFFPDGLKFPYVDVANMILSLSSPAPIPDGTTSLNADPPISPALEQYAKWILEENDCDCHSYAGSQAAYILNDLHLSYPNGLEYPYIQVANAILSICHPQPIIRTPYRVDLDNVSCCDAHNVNGDIEDAKSSAIDMLVAWQVQAISEWASDVPTPEELDEWNNMVCNYSALVMKYDPMTDEYVACGFPSFEEEAKIGWREFSSVEDFLQFRENCRQDLPWEDSNE